MAKEAWGRWPAKMAGLGGRRTFSNYQVCLAVYGPLLLCACAASAPPGHGVWVPPSPAPSHEVTLLDTSCEKSAVYCPRVLAFFALWTSELCSPDGSRTMQIVLSKGKKKTDLIALLVVFFFFLTKYMADAYCVWLYREFYFFLF